jgi:hypothetical protein
MQIITLWWACGIVFRNRICKLTLTTSASFFSLSFSLPASGGWIRTLVLKIISQVLYQGTLAEGEGSGQLASLY